MSVGVDTGPLGERTVHGRAERGGGRGRERQGRWLGTEEARGTSDRIEAYVTKGATGEGARNGRKGTDREKGSGSGKDGRVRQGKEPAGKRAREEGKYTRERQHWKGQRERGRRGRGKERQGRQSQGAVLAVEA